MKRDQNKGQGNDQDQDQDQAATFEWIASDAALVDFCQHLAGQTSFTLDTEFHREKTFYAELALVQVASEERVACIDPLADLDFAPFSALLTNQEILKVLHASRQDLEIFHHLLGEVPAPIFDTQVAASLLGFGDQIGYGDLVQQTCAIHLRKQHGRTDWLRRPLDRDVLAYAAADVIHLRSVYTVLSEALATRARRGWLDEEQHSLLDPATYVVVPEEAWWRVKGTGSLKSAECVVAQAVAAWREVQAATHNRPRRRILADDAIVDLARQQPKNEKALERMRSLQPDIRRRHGAALLRCVQEALESPKASWPQPRAQRKTPVDDSVVDLLGAALKHLAQKAAVSSSVLAARADLEALVRGETDLRIMQGWRYELAGETLSAILAGDQGLHVKDGALMISS